MKIINLHLIPRIVNTTFKLLTNIVKSSLSPYTHHKNQKFTKSIRIHFSFKPQSIKWKLFNSKHFGNKKSNTKVPSRVIAGVSLPLSLSLNLSNSITWSVRAGLLICRTLGNIVRSEGNRCNSCTPLPESVRTSRTPGVEKKERVWGWASID